MTKKSICGNRRLRGHRLKQRNIHIHSNNKRLIVNFLLRLLIFTKKLKGKTDLKKYTYSDHAKLDPNA